MVMFLAFIPCSFGATPLQMFVAWRRTAICHVNLPGGEAEDHKPRLPDVLNNRDKRCQ
jgi:hypothetical protein